jgi:glycosyltransferase involved in cell wall biosynthesis
VAESLADELRLPRGALHVVPNPVIGARSARLSQEKASHPWAAESQVPLVLAVGRLVRQKGFDTLLAAFAKLRERRAARLLILGDGALRGELESQRRGLPCASDVELAGFVANPWPFYRAASVTALSSRFEGLPTVLIEALASGCPCVSTDCPSGPREILDDGRYGVLTPVGDVAALAAALHDALERRWDVEALAARGAEFSVSQATDKYLRLLNDVEARAA